MRPILNAGLVLAALAATATGAEARAGRGLGRFFSAPRLTAPVRPVEAARVPRPGLVVAAGASGRDLRPAGASRGVVPAAALALIASSQMAAPVPAAAEPTRPATVRVAGPWCPSQRTTGSGAGFCEIN